MKSILPYVVLCIILFGISTFFRKLSLDRMHPYQLQVISGVIYLAFLPMWLLILSYQQPGAKYDNLGIFFAVVCILIYTVATVLFGFALKETKSPGVVAALISLSPVITMTLAFFFLDEKFTVTKGIAFALALASAILVNF